MKNTRELLTTMVKSAMSNKSHRSERELKHDKEMDIFRYISTSDVWEDITDEMGAWNDVMTFINSDNQLRVTFMPVGIIVEYTPQLKRI